MVGLFSLLKIKSLPIKKCMLVMLNFERKTTEL